MPIYCVPPQLAQILKDKVSKEDISKLFDMDSAGRRDYWSQYASKEDARLINTEFEKALASSRRNAMKDWAERTFSTEEKKAGNFRSVIDRIEELDQDDLLNPANRQDFLEDLVAEKLGARVTADEARVIVEKTNKLKTFATETDPNIPSLPSIDFFKAKKELDDYLDSLTPSSNLKVFLSTARRGAMLFSIKSPIINIESNTVNAITEFAARRIEEITKAHLPVGSKNELYNKYLAYVNKVYNQTGYDVSRMMTLQDGRKRLGEDIVTSQGPGLIRKVGRFYTDVVFNKLMTAPDVAFASFHFADTANLQATVIARSEGLSGKRLQSRTEELFLDATRLEPKTRKGRIIREKSRLEAERGTYTNKNNYSQVALGLRKVLNQASGDLRLGDQLMPFVQVPATVVGTTLDYSGTLLPVEIVTRSIKALNAVKKGEPEAFRNAFDATFSRKATRAGIGITSALIASTWFKPEDFIGNYPTTQKERELLRLNKASENSVRVGDKWISLDLLGPIGAPFIGMMNAKKYGQDPLSTVLAYASGSAYQAGRIPGFKQFYDLYGSLANIKSWVKDPEQLADDTQQGIVDYLRSATIPAILNDVAKGTDPYERQTNSAVDKLLASIPGVRQLMLEEKLNVFGDKVEGEGFWSTLLAGARLKSATDEPVVNELNRLAQVNQLPSITDVSKTSSRAKDLKKQIGDEEFGKFYIEFGQAFKKEIAALIEDPGYQDQSDEEKKSEIDKTKGRVFNEYLDIYGYTKPENP